MEIDKNNFDAKLDEIKLQIDQCDFLSIDTELTGLHSTKTGFYDTAEVRYKHLRNHSMQYAVTQFGICLFKYNRDNDCVDYAPMNFHLLPCDKSERYNFSVNISTLHFLNTMKFDYNKSWRDGISFISYSEYEKLQKRNNDKKYHELSALDEVVDVDEDFNSLKELIKTCELFMHNDAVNEMTQNFKFSFYENYLVKERLSNRIGCVNGKWLFSTLEYDSQLKQKVIKFIKCEDYIECKRQQILEHYAKKEEMLIKQLRFSEIIKHISNSKKLLVGHNCLLDCLHMFDKFIGPLPETFIEFKKVFNGFFPNCLDTKYMLCETKLADFKDIVYKNLQGFHEASTSLSNNPKYRPLTEEYTFLEGSKFHTANYDAMITGILFLNMLTEIADHNTDIMKNFESNALKMLTKFKNKFNLVRAELCFINVDPSSKEYVIKRGNIFHVTIPFYWQTNDLLIQLSVLLKKSLKEVFESVKLDWINDTSVMVKFADNVNVSGVPLGNSGKVTIVKYHEFYNDEDNNNEVMNIMTDGGFTVVKSKKRKINTV